MPEVRFKFFCEDVRSEVNGKVSAIGLLGNTMLIIGAPPTRLRAIAFLAYVSSNVPFEFRFTLNGPGLPALEQAGRAEIQPPQTGTFLNWIVEGPTVVAAGRFVARLEFPGVGVFEETLDVRYGGPAAG